MTTYYVDLDAGSSGSGTFANPFNSPEDVESEGLSTGDHCYFKCGTSFTYSSDAENWNINWSGTSSSVRSHIGAYYDDGGSPEADYETVKSQIDLAIEDYPEISGNWTDSYCAGSQNYKGQLNVNVNNHYLYVENLRIVNCTGRGFLCDADLSDTITYVDVRHCYFNHTWSLAVMFYSDGVSYCDVYDCFSDDASRKKFEGYWESCSQPGANTYGYNLGVRQGAHHCELHDNILRRTMGESINTGGSEPATDCEVYGNIIEGFHSVGIYFNGQNQNVYNNMIIGTNATVPGKTTKYHRNTGNGSGWGLSIGNEGGPAASRGSVAWNNLVAWCAPGMRIVCNTTDSTNDVDCTLYHNTLIDTGYGAHPDGYVVFVLKGGAGGDFATGHPIFKNNIFANYTNNSTIDQLVNANAGSYGDTYDYNCWYTKYSGKTQPENANCRGANDVGGDPKMATATGWVDNIDIYTDVSWTDFQLTTTSPCDDACNRITGYEDDYIGTTRDP